MRKRIPDFLKRGVIDTAQTRFVRNILKEKGLNTVCNEARCPNKGECYSNKTATFMILGKNCTRSCRFCSISDEEPQQIDKNEPQKIAEAIKELGIKYVVITSVTRDDLIDEGANHFANVIKAIKKIDKNILVEVLVPDFNGKKELIDIVIKARPDVYNHNLETIEKFYSRVRPQANYKQSLAVLSYVKNKAPDIYTKTGIMLGFGETYEELEMLFDDASEHNIDIITAGQYMQPTKKHLPVEKYYEEDEYQILENLARQKGIKKVIFGPLVRSSYKAKEVLIK